MPQKKKAKPRKKIAVRSDDSESEHDRHPAEPAWSQKDADAESEIEPSQVTTVQEESQERRQSSQTPPQSQSQVMQSSQMPASQPILSKKTKIHITPDQEEAMISWYEQHPVLWDTGSRDYRNASLAKRDAMYNDYAQSCDIPGAQGYHIKDRIKIRKDTFARYTKQMAGKSGSRYVPPTEANLAVVQRMGFLTGKVGRREKHHSSASWPIALAAATATRPRSPTPPLPKMPKLHIATRDSSEDESTSEAAYVPRRRREGWPPAQPPAQPQAQPPAQPQAQPPAQPPVQSTVQQILTTLPDLQEQVKTYMEKYVSGNQAEKNHVKFPVEDKTDESIVHAFRAVYPMVKDIAAKNRKVYLKYCIEHSSLLARLHDEAFVERTSTPKKSTVQTYRSLSADEVLVAPSECTVLQHLPKPTTKKCTKTLFQPPTSDQQQQVVHSQQSSLFEPSQSPVSEQQQQQVRHSQQHSSLFEPNQSPVSEQQQQQVRHSQHSSLFQQTQLPLSDHLYTQTQTTISNQQQFEDGTEIDWPTINLSMPSPFGQCFKPLPDTPGTGQLHTPHLKLQTPSAASYQAISPATTNSNVSEDEGGKN